MGCKTIVDHALIKDGFIHHEIAADFALITQFNDLQIIVYACNFFPHSDNFRTFDAIPEDFAHAGGNAYNFRYIVYSADVGDAIEGIEQKMWIDLPLQSGKLGLALQELSLVQLRLSRKYRAVGVFQPVEHLVDAVCNCGNFIRRMDLNAPFGMARAYILQKRNDAPHTARYALADGKMRCQ